MSYGHHRCRRRHSQRPARGGYHTLLRVETLERRDLLALLLNPVVSASIHDEPGGAVGDSFNTTFPQLIRQQFSSEDRAIVEFELGAIAEPVNLAVLDLRIAGGIFGPAVRTFDLVGYAGNGQADLTDFSPAGSVIRTVSLWGEQGEGVYRLDVTSRITELLSGGATHFGLMVDSQDDVVPSYLTDVKLSINGLPPPSGQRAWETVPNAIRADGAESFRVEVDLHGEVRSVTLSPWLSQFVGPGTENQALRDDGLEGDRVAGDFIYTSGEFRFNTAQPFPTPFYENSPDSPPGVAIVDVGTLTIAELDGSVSEFLIRPQVGLVDSNLPVATTQPVGSDLLVSDHLINVRTTAQATQRTLRGNQIVLNQITQPILAQLPDEFDFFTFFSTQHIENVPPLTSRNFFAGAHVSVQFDYTGTGWEPFDRSDNYGSTTGRLLGLNMLDTLRRGITDANATHELVHQWSAYLPTSLGISDGTHFRHNTSVGSLVGGQQWIDNGDGSYTIDFEEGRNGATHASSLDLYLMGLVETSAVPPVLVYNPTVQPPKSLFNPVIAANEIVDTVTIEEIMAAAGGPRTPGPDAAQRDFRIGFVAESHNRFLTQTEMRFYEIFAANYAKTIPADEPDPHLDHAWAPMSRFVGHGSTWTTLLPQHSETPNEPPAVQSGAWEVPETAVTGTVAGTIVASDPDEGQSLVYAISEGNEDFTFLIDSATGEITVNRSLDAETNAEYVLTVLVADTGIPSQYDSTSITIRVAGVGSEPPVISPGQVFLVAENAANGTDVGTVLANDPDTPVSDLTGFIIVSGNEDGTLAIDAATGRITVTDGSRLDYETARSRTLQVRVSDGVHDSALEAVLIELTNVNEPPAVPDQTFTVAENSPTGTAVGPVAATDPDADQSRTFRIAAGNVANAFAIDPVTGLLTVNNPAALDYEARTSISLTVEATDSGSPALSASGTIKVDLTDVLELVMDIKPGDATNTINVKTESKIAVAILSTSSFDAAAQIDVNSLTFGQTGVENSLLRNRKTGLPQYEVRDVDGDGLLDLVVSFDTAKTGLTVGATQATLKGRLKDGTTFQLTGPVRVVSSKR
jgi:cadherin domain-containing protein